MALPFFYINNYNAAQKEIVLDEDTSKHIVQVLRMKVREQLNLTDGKGKLLTCEIAEANKKHCAVNVTHSRLTTHHSRRITIAISLLKNSNRFEWFLEKATEIGVNEIIPLICERTEKEKFRFDRMQGICISAMLQSQQVWLPVLHQPIEFNKAVIKSSAKGKFIAHCVDGGKDLPITIGITNQPINQSTIILIGPEGDFTAKEIELALQNDFIPVSLGETRLRTETAGIVAATVLRLM
jgi:16S rRNA (uracil1498-N3)-methyltransferase